MFRSHPRVVTGRRRVPDNSSPVGNWGRSGSDRESMADHLKMLQRESKRHDVSRAIGWYEITIFLVLLCGVALIAWARATAP